jgi:hypothetical protein
VIWALYSIVVKPDLPKRSFIFVYILVRVITCLIDIMCSDFNLRVCIWILIVRIGTGSYGRGGCRVSNTLCRSIAILVVHWCLIIEYERCRVKLRRSLSQKIFIANVLKSAHLNMLNQTQSVHHLLLGPNFSQTGLTIWYRWIIFSGLSWLRLSKGGNPETQITST